MHERSPEALYAKALAIAHAALDLAPGERAGHLAAHCDMDDALRHEVQWLMSAASDAALDELPSSITEASAELAANLHIDATAPGRYRLIEPIGEGGMGMVWLAEREVGGARQRVALKRLRAGSVLQRSRFHDEQRILAALNHPNIAHLVDAGIDAGGEPFLAMEHVEGERIDRWADARGADLRGRIGVFLKVCAAVSHAHEHLVIHRDLKPANILVAASGEPKLLDFGIARLLDADTTATTTAYAMTLAYASPEQIQGTPLGTATDIYSLGVVLYELLAGTRPFATLATDRERSNAIVAGTVMPPSQQPSQAAVPGQPRQRSRRIPADIDAIVLKALRREPAQRYASVRDFADDLERFLAARPVRARRGQWLYRTQRFVQRNRWPLAVATVLVAVVTAFTWRTVLAERDARQQALVADRTTEFLIAAFSLSDPTQAERHDFSARDVLDRGRQRVDEELSDQPRVRARLLEALGNAYRGINEGSAGAPLLDEAARLNLDPAVDDPLAAARSLRAKAIGILAVRGATDEAERAARKALDLVRLHAGDDIAAVADFHGTLAKALNASGKDIEALQAARQAHALHEAGGSGLTALAQSVSDLCAITAGTGEFAQALPYCRQALALYDEARATRSNAYREALSQYAITLLYHGDSDTGLAQLRKRNALTRELYGEHSSALAMDQVLFAEKLAEHGQFDEAAASLATAMPVIQQRNGMRSTQHAFAVFHAGWLRYALGEFDAAVPLLREALAIHESVVDGRDNGRLQVLRVTLATALIDAGRADAEARALLDSVIAVRSAAHADTVNLAYARLPLAKWHVLNGDYSAAESLLGLVDAVGPRVEKELHARAAATRAALLRARGDAGDALRQDQLAYETTRQDRGADHPRTARYALGYARALRASGDTAMARQLEREYRPRVEQAYPTTSAFRQALTAP